MASVCVSRVEYLSRCWADIAMLVSLRKQVYTVFFFYVYINLHVDNQDHPDLIALCISGAVPPQHVVFYTSNQLLNRFKHHNRIISCILGMNDRMIVHSMQCQL